MDSEIKISQDEINKNLESCICQNCGFEDYLGIDEVSCDQKICSKCGQKMSLELNEQNMNLMDQLKSADSVDAKFKILLENINKPTKQTAPHVISESADSVNPDINYKTKFYCKRCSTVISEAVYMAESICPGCGDDFIILENINEFDSQRRFICPECNSSFKYSKINEDACQFCNSLMTVFDTPIIKQSKTAIPME